MADSYPKKHLPAASGKGNIILTRVRNDPFARVPKDVLRIPGLSYKAKGILAYLLGKPPGWIIRTADLQANGRESRDSILAGMKELRAFGYAKQDRQHDERGRIKTVWKVADAPIFKLGPEPDFPEPDNPLLSKKDSTKRHLLRPQKRYKLPRDWRHRPDLAPEAEALERERRGEYRSF